MTVQDEQRVAEIKARCEGFLSLIAASNKMDSLQFDSLLSEFDTLVASYDTTDPLEVVCSQVAIAALLAFREEWIKSGTHPQAISDLIVSFMKDRPDGGAILFYAFGSTVAESVDRDEDYEQFLARGREEGWENEELLEEFGARLIDWAADAKLRK